MSHNGLSPVMGRITIGSDMVQFSCKIEADHTPEQSTKQTENSMTAQTSRKEMLKKNKKKFHVIFFILFVPSLMRIF